MNKGGPTAFTKMRQVYWEAKQSFNKSIGQREDSCIISSDNELDIRIDHLQAADYSFNVLLKVILDYRNALQKLGNTQENLGLILIEFGTKDSTAAGKVMCMTGKAVSKVAYRQSQLKTHLMNLFHEVQTFQYKATADALQTVGKMEKVRRSYRSGLMWLKNESADLDPDVSKKLKNFKKVQEHIKRLKVKFDGVKLESMQKIDLFLLSRSNLFSHTLSPYIKSFKKMCKHSAIFTEQTLKNIPLSLSYDFVTLKELNQYSKILQASIQHQPHFLEKEIEKQKKKRLEEKKRSSSVPQKSTIKKTFSTYSCASVSEIDEVCSQRSEISADTMLIDLKEEGRKNQSLSQLLLDKDNSKSSTNYSEDLSSINFDEYSRFHAIESSTKNAESNSENISGDSALKGSSNDGLYFWSLIQTHEQASKLLDVENQDKKNSSNKQSTENLTDSKWNDILVNFDPFLDEMPKRKNKEESSELC